MMRPPSSIVGTTPLGFISRYHFWSLPPNAPPTSSRVYFNPHSSDVHSTFMTLIELARPQIFISHLSSISALPLDLTIDDLHELLRIRIFHRKGYAFDAFEFHMRIVDPNRLRPQPSRRLSTFAIRPVLDLQYQRRFDTKINEVELAACHDICVIGNGIASRWRSY